MYFGINTNERFTNKTVTSECGYALNQLPTIDTNRGNLHTIYVNLNGIKYKWDNSPINSIRLTNFDFDRHTVNVIINDTEPNCKTIEATDNTITVKNAYLNLDFTYYMVNNDIYMKNTNGNYKLQMV
ncbi:MAG: hypothetical protein Homavirus10_11 [Homavirus sp.]|uniref:Uncharacterized protein n=1 Tax=Homavirus sp. TaxID=2487769 RepID=A0A3G5A529_9VIRU|nr:MAG: hypothetical protein Homavirus10_11 [Homavirus sp.]